MTTHSTDVHEFPAGPATPAVSTSATRPMYWSVRREIWENRSILIAPLVIAAFVFLGSFIGTMNLPRKMDALSAAEPARQNATLIKPYSMAPAPIMLATFLVGIFYSIDTLYGERRDRSILFWKSLPVSDRTSVLSKASIPLVVLPLIAFCLSVVTQILLLVLSAPILAGRGVSPLRIWNELHFFEGLVIMLYGLTIHALWFAPIYGVLMLISAAARRSPIIMVALPIVAIAAVERMAFNTFHFVQMLGYRVMGAMSIAFRTPDATSGGDINRLSQLTPLRFLSSPALWLGLIVAAGCLAAAIRLRRNREPM